MTSFERMIRNSAVILTEGALAERLKREFNLAMDPAINHAGVIYEAPEILETLYCQYIEIGLRFRLPILLMTPTRRVNSETLPLSRWPDRPVIGDTCRFLNRIRERYDPEAEKIWIGGLLGCRGDAYSGRKGMDAEESYDFHRRQVTDFSRQDIHFLFAGIMPEAEEAIGMAAAMAESGLPFIISFMVTRNGCLPDGTPLSEAIRRIDDRTDPKPVAFMTNCIHPSNLLYALGQEVNRNNPSLARLWGIQANASALEPGELDGNPTLKQDDFDSIVDRMIDLRSTFGMKIFGGCCGTDDLFLKKLARRLVLP